MATKTNGGLVSTPPIPAWKALHNLEKLYKEKSERLDRAEKKIEMLEAKVRELKARLK